MIPYLQLDPNGWRSVTALLREYAVGVEDFVTIRVVFEEFGGDEEGIRDVIQIMTEQGLLREGLWEDVSRYMGGGHADPQKWRYVPRAVNVR